MYQPTDAQSVFFFAGHGHGVYDADGFAYTAEQLNIFLSLLLLLLFLESFGLRWVLSSKSITYIGN